IENIGMKHRLGAIDILDKTLDSAHKGKCFFLGVALIYEMDFDPVVEKGKFPQPLGKYVVVVFDISEYFLARQKMYFGTTPFSLSGRSQGCHRHAHAKLDLMDLSIST